MKHTILRALSLASFLLIFCFDLAAADFKKGLWEMAFTMSIKGMPIAMPIPAQVQTQCIDKDEFIPETSQQQGCNYSIKRNSNNSIEWSISCKDGKMKGNGEMIYTKTTMKGNMQVEMAMGGQKVTMVTDITGKYIGPCK